MAQPSDNNGTHFGRGLLVQSGPDAGALVPLRTPSTLVGSGVSCDVCLNADGVQPLHCILTPTDEVISLRAIGDSVVRMNGRAVTDVDLVNGDAFEIGITRFVVQWPSTESLDDASFESLRIQAAAVAAQQAALNELEIALTDRETALSGQEADLATRLEHQRRQLLELQQQVAHARFELRDRRRDFATLVTQQESELDATRREVTKAKSQIARREQRLARLWAKLKNRIAQQNVEMRRQQQQLISDAKRAAKGLATKLGALKHERMQYHTHAELEKRQLADGWEKLQQAETALNQRLNAIARKEKDLVGLEIQVKASNTQLQARRDALRREIETLEARALNARNSLVRLYSHESPPAPAPVAMSECELELTHVAEELTDGQSQLAQQVGHFAIVRMTWEEERVQLLNELERLTKELAQKEDRIAAGEINLATASQQRAAEQTKIETYLVSRGAELNRYAAVLAARSRELDRRQELHNDLYLRWGRRRTEALAVLRNAMLANVAAREEWASLHDRWLRAQSRLINDQKELAARQLAVEQYRRDIIDAADHPELAAKRLERLRRQWANRCKAGVRDLRRLSALLKIESARLDQRFTDLQHEEAKIQNRANDLDDLVAVAEIQEVGTAAERAQRAEQSAAEADQRASYERQIAALRDHIDRLSALFIESPATTDSRAA
jgi:chromosome segregation ATPase